MVGILVRNKALLLFALVIFLSSFLVGINSSSSQSPGDVHKNEIISIERSEDGIYVTSLSIPQSLNNQTESCSIPPPSLISPGDGEMLDRIAPSMRCSKSETGLSKYQIATDVNFDNFVRSSGVQTLPEYDSGT